MTTLKQAFVNTYWYLNADMGGLDWEEQLETVLDADRLEQFGPGMGSEINPEALAEFRAKSWQEQCAQFTKLIKRLAN